ncbi:MAG: hypothetical protein KJ737_00020 [Proteobacteria bacterium]|nr:hypothetical protein [Pseudomonadota bacterium]
MVLKKNPQVFQNRLRALFALSIHKKHTDQKECLSVDEMAALIDGRITPQKRNILLSHLDACPSCYAEWLAAAAMVSDDEEAQCDPIKKDGFFRKYKNTFVSSMAVAAALILIVLLTIYHQPAVPSLINDQYKMAFDSGLSLTNLNSPIDSDTESSKSLFQFYGFGGSTNAPSSPFAQSFISGFQTGRIILMSSSELLKNSEEPKNDYFWAGRWFALLSSACESKGQIPDSFWEVQQKSIGLFRGIFNRHAKEESEAVILVRSIERINVGIVQKKSSSCQLIRWELNFILEGLNQPI